MRFPEEHDFLFGEKPQRLGGLSQRLLEPVRRSISSDALASGARHCSAFRLSFHCLSSCLSSPRRYAFRLCFHAALASAELEERSTRRRRYRQASRAEGLLAAEQRLALAKTLSRSLGMHSVRILPLPCVSTAFAAKTVPLHCASNAFAAKTLPFLADLQALGVLPGGGDLHELIASGLSGETNHLRRRQVILRTMLAWDPFGAAEPSVPAARLLHPLAAAIGRFETARHNPHERKVFRRRPSLVFPPPFHCLSSLRRCLSHVFPPQGALGQPASVRHSLSCRFHCLSDLRRCLSLQDQRGRVGGGAGPCRVAGRECPAR